MIINNIIIMTSYNNYPVYQYINSLYFIIDRQKTIVDKSFNSTGIQIKHTNVDNKSVQIKQSNDQNTPLP